MNNLFCDETDKLMQTLLFEENSNIFLDHLNKLRSQIQRCTINDDLLDLVDIHLLEEIKAITNCAKTRVYFGKTLRDLKCVIQDKEFREHKIFISYRGPGKLCVSFVKLPQTNLQDREYASLNDIVTAFNTYVNELAYYFQELELIDEFCTVVEPAHPSFKDDYRKILLDDRVWLHLEVTPEGLATNIQLVGQSEHWQNKLQNGLLLWDHDKNIITNIMKVFDITEFPKITKTTVPGKVEDEGDSKADNPTCSICLCVELPNVIGVPQPLCQNNKCGVYYHRNCLYQWLVTCAGNRSPAFGVATGSCPTCLQPIVCNEKNY